MKKFLNISLIAILLGISFSNTHKNEFPNTFIQKDVVLDIDSCILKTNNFINVIENQRKIDYIENYNTYLVEIDKQRTELNNNFFSGEALYEQLK